MSVAMTGVQALTAVLPCPDDRELAPLWPAALEPSAGSAKPTALGTALSIIHGPMCVMPARPHRGPLGCVSETAGRSGGFTAWGVRDAPTASGLVCPSGLRTTPASARSGG